MTAPDKSDDFITVSFSLVRSNNQPANVRGSPSVADRARHDSVNNIFCGYIYFHPVSQSGYGPVAVAGVINGAVNAVKSKGFGSVPRFCCLRACISPPDAEHPFKPCVGYDAQAASNGILTWQRIPYPGQEITLSVKTDNIFRQKSTPKAECAGYRQTAFCPVVNVALCFHRGRTFQPQIIRDFCCAFSPAAAISDRWLAIFRVPVSAASMSFLACSAARA